MKKTLIATALLAVWVPSVLFVARAQQTWTAQGLTADETHGGAPLIPLWQLGAFGVCGLVAVGVPAGWVMIRRRRAS